MSNSTFRLNLLTPSQHRLELSEEAAKEENNGYKHNPFCHQLQVVSEYVEQTR